MTIAVTLEYVDDCPNHEVLRSRLVEAARRSGSDIVINEVAITSLEEAEQRDFVGSPTVRLNGIDHFAQPGAVPALACRMYPTPDGLTGAPSVEQLTVLLRT